MHRYPASCIRQPMDSTDPRHLAERIKNPFSRLPEPADALARRLGVCVSVSALSARAALLRMLKRKPC